MKEILGASFRVVEPEREVYGNRTIGDEFYETCGVYLHSEAGPYAVWYPADARAPFIAIRRADVSEWAVVFSNEGPRHIGFGKFPELYEKLKQLGYACYVDGKREE